ncbi:MAG TPA: ABC transporter permease [Terriglobia bacterium]|nr:ABC transporter permease [Terriglobia bacterium]
MEWIRELARRVLMLWRGRQFDRDLDDEIRLHRELREQQQIEAGASPEEAHYAVSRRFGNATTLKEESRDLWGWTWVERIGQDLRYALRTLTRDRGFALVAMLTLALGIGANTTMFSVINATLLKPIPFPDPQRLVLVWETFGKGPDNINIVSAPNFWDFQRQSHSFEGIAIMDSAGRGYNLSPTGTKREPEQVSGLRVSAGFFPVLGVKPFLGRTFLPEEEVPGKDHEVVLSYGLWKRRYGGDPALLGHTVKIDGEDFSVVGVMPRDFEWQFWSSQRQLWVPVGYTKTDYGRDNNSFIAFARLKPDVTVAQARSEMEAIGRRLARQYPTENAGMGATVMPMSDFGLEGIRATLLALLAAVGFVLLIACVNVANLLLARGASRQKEFAVRRALGAGAARIARQLLTESLLLALLGGAAGLLLAVWSNDLLFRAFRLDNLRLPMRQLDSLTMDGRVFGFTLLVSCLTGVLFGLVPAFSALRGDVNEPLKEGGRGSSEGGKGRLRHALVASEVALALVVLCGAGLMIKSVARLLGVDPGLDPKNVLTMGMSVPQEAIYVGPPGLPRFCQDLDDHVGAIPGVISVGAVGHLPFEGNAGRGFQIEGQPPAEPAHMPNADYSVACPSYFRTMGVPVLKGREFTHQDSLASPGVIVVDESMARKYWPKEDPVGRAIRLGGSDGPRLTVVGVVGDVHHLGLDEPMRPQFFRPYTQAGWPVMSVVVRTASAPGAFTAEIKRAIAEFLPDRPVSGVETMEQVVHDSTGSRRFPMLLLSVFSGFALLLAAVGIIGVVSYSVTQRTHEIGIRMALGARRADVLHLVLSRNMAWVFGGIGVGVAGSIGLARLLRNLLFDVRPADPVVLAAVAITLAAVALVASYLPARRAAKVDPMVALRCE